LVYQLFVITSSLLMICRLLVIINDSKLDNANAKDKVEAASNNINIIKAKQDASLSSTLPN
jgi:hypothetical protein